MQRRFGRRPGRPFAPDVPPRLRQANRLMSQGNYSEAATALEQLARAAEERGGPRAPLFYIQAGRARAMAAQPEAALTLMQHGLDLFAARGFSGRVAGFGGRLLAELAQHGYPKESRALAEHLKGMTPDLGAGLSSKPSVSRPVLPTHCPGCGAPVRPDEVEWLDDITAECAFCGTPVRGA